ncbi:MAG TPA: protease modulator HflC [Pseudomonadales bacterium]|jgi:membrane protease subunit HflC|nr:protease modulator HflC [Pseudomonadales bacterium]
MNRIGNILLAILAVIWLTGQFVFVVFEFDKAVVLQFGKLVKSDIKPGLHFRVPFVDEVRRFDGRIQTLDTRAERYPTVEKKSVMVDLYAHWKITDVARYYTATGGDAMRAELLISQRINEGLRNQFGVRTLHEVVSGERDALMVNMTQKLTDITSKELGIEVVDVRVKRIELPDEVSVDVYNRMNSERAREARKHRSEGKEVAEGIRADADRQKIVLEAEAYGEAEKIRGEGDAKATAIYAAAYGKNSELFNFTRSLQAYRDSFSSGTNMLVLDPNNSFFSYLKNPDGKAQ